MIKPKSTTLVACLLVLSVAAVMIAGTIYATAPMQKEPALVQATDSEQVTQPQGEPEVVPLLPDPPANTQITEGSIPSISSATVDSSIIQPDQPQPQQNP